MSKVKSFHIATLAVAACALGACSGCQWTPAQSTALRPATAPTATAPLATRKLPSDAEATEATIRFMANRVRHDPEDFTAQNGLAGSLLQRVRETNNLDYLVLANHAARASLKSVPEERNSGGLAILAQAEFTAHGFAAARDHARRLSKLEPAKSEPYALAGDASLELGDYAAADKAFAWMRALGGKTIGVETRSARFTWLKGQPQEARRHYFTALALALNQPVPPRETVAWCRWQLGETAFSIGDYPTAEQHYRDALITFPHYFRALASLGRVRAARGDRADAIKQYEQAIQVVPDPNFVAALGDLYALTGRQQDAASRYNIVEQIAHLSAVNGTLYNRQLALFYADHNLKPQLAYAHATKEYAVRRDIYGADAVAWTALKAGKLEVAQPAIQQALRLGTRDARLFYHAGMIARAGGAKAAARAYLQRALALNPQFDPLQATVARRTLQALAAAKDSST